MKTIFNNHGRCNACTVGVMVVLLYCCLTASVSVSAQRTAGSDFVPDSIIEEYSEYVIFLPPDKLDSALVYSNVGHIPVVYHTNQYTLIQTEELDSITQLINKAMNDPRIKLAYVWIAGSCSPDGRTINNLMLGELRAEALGNYLCLHTPLTLDRLRMENIGEDWDSVRIAVENGDFPNRDKILEIIASESNSDRREERIRRIDNGRTWSLLVRDVFPSLRNSHIVIVCCLNEPVVVKEPEPTETIVERVVIIEPPLYVPLEQEPVSAKTPETRFIALKTNVPFLGALIFNVAIEAELWRHWSLDVPVYYSPYNVTPTWKVRLMATQPELRWWPKDAGEGHFFGAHAHAAGFNIAINDNGRYQDPNRAAWGFGLGYGYALGFGQQKNWGMEFNIGIGFVDYAYDAFYNRTNGLEYKSGSGTYWGVTRAGISFYYKWRFPRK